jgi:hypothetical protein
MTLAKTTWALEIFGGGRFMTPGPVDAAPSL